MLERIFPREISNRFPGIWNLGLWLFVPLVVLKLGIGAKSMLDARDTAISADGIPLSSFPPAAADMVVSTFALLGMFHFLLGLFGVLALVRYRAMIPLLYLLFLVQTLMTRTLNQIYPTAHVGGGRGAIVAFVILSLTVLGFVLSLVPRSARAAAVTA